MKKSKMAKRFTYNVLMSKKQNGYQNVNLTSFLYLWLDIAQLVVYV